MSTLYVDSRVGSIELLPALLKLGLPAEKAMLDEGDFAFEGNGSYGTVLVGVERKVVSDLVQSVQTKRINDQLGRMTPTYDYLWLLVEGVWGSDRQGRLTWRKGWRGAQRIPGGFTEDGLAKALLSLELRTQAGADGRLRIKQTFTQHHTAVWLSSLFHSFTDKPWSGHTSHLGSHEPTAFQPLSLFRRIVQQLPDVGLSTSLALEQAYNGSLGRLRRTGIDEMADIETQTPRGPRKLGLAKAGRIVLALQELL